MALIKCKECKSEVSSKAETCPKCGARVAAKPMGCGSRIVGILLMVVATYYVLDLFSSNTKNDNTSTKVKSTQPAYQPTYIRPPEWTYGQSDDPMSKGTFYMASILSSDTVNFDSPYDGEQRAKLMLRTSPRTKKNIIFSIEKGQILCRSSYQDCTVLVRFDNGKAVNFPTSGASDNSTEIIFISNYSKFVKKMLKAKRVRIAVNIYHEGSPTFEFDVSGFEQNRYIPKK